MLLLQACSFDPTGNGTSKMNLEEWFKLAESSERKDGKDTRVGLSPRCRLVSSEGLDGTSRAAAQRQRIAAQTSWKKKVESGVRL